MDLTNMIPGGAGEEQAVEQRLSKEEYSDGIDSVILKVMKPNTSRRFFW